MASKENYDDNDITTKELDKLHKSYKEIIDKTHFDIESDSVTDDSDSDIDEPKFTVKPIEKSSSKKETTMLYIFKKYERLQNECNVYKNKLFKMKIRTNSNEQIQHYKNLEFSNLIVEKQRLQEELEKKHYISVKYYISFIFNLILGYSIFWLYQRFDEY